MVFVQAPELTGGQRGSLLLPTGEFVHEGGLKAEFGSKVLPTRIFSDLVEERQYEGPGTARFPPPNLRESLVEPRVASTADAR